RSSHCMRAPRARALALIPSPRAWAHSRCARSRSCRSRWRHQTTRVRFVDMDCGSRGQDMAWFMLVAAGVVEIAMAISLKFAAGWTRLWPSVGGLAAALASVALLTFAVKSLPVTTAYAIWTGIGAVGVTLVGIL